MIFLVTIIFHSVFSTVTASYENVKQSSESSTEDIYFENTSMENSGTEEELLLWSGVEENISVLRERRKIEHIIGFEGLIRKRFLIEALVRHPTENLVCSLLSALLPLGKLALGASETSDTFFEIMEAIGVKTRKDISKSYKRMLNNMKQLPGITLDVASRIYIQKNRRIRSKFVNDTNDIFGSNVESVNFDQGDVASKTINNWISNNTHNKINEITDSREFSKSTSMVLVNGVFFTGKWGLTFEKIYEDYFMSADNKKYRVTMMKKTDKVLYHQSNSLQAEMIGIPYIENQAHLIIVLPMSLDGLPVTMDVLRLDPEELNSRLDQMVEREMHVTIPRFRVESHLNMVELYGNVGVKKIFESPSELDQITKSLSELSVSNAVQKTVIEVDAHGATKAGKGPVTYDQVLQQYYKFPEFRADRPFLFFVVAKKEQLVAGVIRHFK